MINKNDTTLSTQNSEDDKEISLCCNRIVPLFMQYFEAPLIEVTGTVNLEAEGNTIEEKISQIPRLLQKSSAGFQVSHVDVFGWITQSDTFVLNTQTYSSESLHRLSEDESEHVWFNDLDLS
jgi:hypothetical protein